LVYATIDGEPSKQLTQLRNSKGAVQLLYSKPIPLELTAEIAIWRHETGSTIERRKLMPKARKMLSDWDAPYIQPLVQLIETQSKATLAHWAVDYAEQAILPLWSRHYPDDPRPRQALNAAREWLAGAIKLPPAKTAILECHAAAREAEGNPVAQAAARAIGQCASTIHSARHCIGLALYGAVAVAYDTLGTDAAWKQLEQCAADECGRMLDALRAVSVENELNPAKIDWKC
jgi:hypothetical protein